MSGLTNKEIEDMSKEEATKTGGSTPNQYRKSMILPMTDDREMYRKVDVEVMDVCGAWGFDQSEHNILKAFCRAGKKDGTSLSYDGNKVMLFALRWNLDRGLITHKKFWETLVFLGIAEEV